MSDDMGQTASRKPIQQERRARQTDRPVSGVPQAPRRAQGQGQQRARQGQHAAQKSRGGSQQRRTQSSNVPQRRRRSSVPARHASPPSQQRQRAKKPGVRVPLALFVVALVLCVVGSVLITRAIMIGEVREARSEATAAQNKVTSLANELEQERKNAKATSATGTTTTEADGKKDTATGEGVESPWITDGKFSSGDATLDEEVKAYVDGIVDSSMDVDSAAFEMYKSIAWSNYVERDSAQKPSGKDWRTQFARQYYENDCSGNCYEFSAFLSYCLRYMGYADAKAEGAEIELQSGNWGDHAIVYVTNKDGSSCICDTARGTNAWMIPSTSYNLKIVDFENA
ncbi:MAG: hypothetical protein Q4A01_02410 [Coriobacteriales bacterium]|nr:hypothetical protein [Coriobacteriales bacterium]